METIFLRFFIDHLFSTESQNKFDNVKLIIYKFN